MKGTLRVLVVIGLAVIGLQACKKDPELSNLSGISSFAIKGFETFDFTIDQNALTIANVDSLPYLTDPAALVAVFTAIPGSVVKVGATVQESGVTANNFASELSYQTTAEDGVTVRTYKVKVNIEQIDPKTVSWQRLTDNGGWGPFRTAAAGQHGGKFWVLGAASGGFGSFSYGAFSSADAVNWTKETTSVDTLPYAERSAAVFGFQNKVWLLGGLVPAKGLFFSHITNATWSATDGLNWAGTPRVVTPEDGQIWTGRERLGAVVFQDKLWVIGGNNYPAFGNANSPGVPLNDVWSTDNGTDWTRVTASAPFIARTNPAVFVHDAKLYVVGGRNASGTLLSDVWTSTDGANWTEVTTTGTFKPVWGHQVVSYGGELFLIGGYVKNDADADVIQQALWVSEDNGVSWTEVEAGNPRALPGNFPGRAFFNAFVHENAIWIVGGEYRNDANAQAYRNDTWKGALVK